MDIAQLITAFGVGGIAVAIIGWLKDRRKIHSDADLTDVQTLINKLAYLEKVIENIDKHNDRLQADLDASEERERKRIQRIRELEDEVDTLRRGLRNMEAQCERLSERLSEFLTEDHRS